MHEPDPAATGFTTGGGKPPPAGGDVAAWVSEHWDSVYQLLYRLTRSAHDAEDFAQETFLRAVEKQAAFQQGTNRRAWLLRIATNLFLDQCRRKKAMKIGPLEGVAEQSVADDETTEPSRGLVSQEVGDAVQAAIAELAETPRAVFLLRVDQELEFAEIASIIGTTEATARWHLMQARRQLMARLEGKV